MRRIVGFPRRFLPRLPALLISLVAVGACRRVPDPTLTRTAEAQRLTGALRVDLAKTIDGSDRAVMADTDVESIAFAHEAERATAAVRSDAAKLAALVQSLGYRDEAAAVDEFERHFEDYAKVDQGVLALAVENTNLKAQRLSFGPVREAADAWRDALEAALKTLPEREQARADAVVARAELAVREIQVLQAPHIAAPDDAEMARLEKEMATREDAARRALTTLASLGGASGASTLAPARAALERFGAESQELIALSRRNSNVRSLAISLRQVPTLAAACDASLAVLDAALAKEGSSATR